MLNEGRGSNDIVEHQLSRRFEFLLRVTRVMNEIGVLKVVHKVSKNRDNEKKRDVPKHPFQGFYERTNSQQPQSNSEEFP